MKNHVLEDDMRYRLREHFMQRKHVQVAARAFGVTQQMSGALQTETIIACYGGWMSQIAFLRGCEMNCIVQVGRSGVVPVERRLPARPFFVC